MSEALTKLRQIHEQMGPVCSDEIDSALDEVRGRDPWHNAATCKQCAELRERKTGS